MLAADDAPVRPFCVQYPCGSGSMGSLMEALSKNLGIRPGALSWPSALIAILIVRGVVSFTAKPGSSLLAYGGINYFVLLLLATGFAIRDGIQNTLGVGHSGCCWELAMPCGCWTSQFFSFTNLLCTLRCPGGNCDAGCACGHFEPARSVPLDDDLPPLIGRVCVVR